jgi:hypothetical protein
MIANLLKPFSIGLRAGPTREDPILAVSDEEHDQVLTALVGNWDRTSTRGLEH